MAGGSIGGQWFVENLKFTLFFITFARCCSFVRCKFYVNFHTNSLFPIQIHIILHLGNLCFLLLLLFPSRITWDQALFSFRFVNNIPAGKAKRKENLISGPISAGLPKRECMTTAKIGPDLRLLRGPQSLSSVFVDLIFFFTVTWHRGLFFQDFKMASMTTRRSAKMDRVLVTVGAIVGINIVSIVGTSFLSLNEKIKYKLILVQSWLTLQSVMFFSARYLWIRLCSPLYNHPSNINRLLLAFIIIVLSLSQGSIVLGLIFSGVEPHWISLLSYTSLGLLILLTSTTVISDLITWIFGVINLRSGLVNSRIHYARFQVILILVISTTLAVLALQNSIKEPMVKKVRIPMKNLPSEFNGFTIVMLPDIHVGPTVGRTMLERVVKTTNQLNPDAVSINGDLVDASVYQIRQAVKPLLKLRARYGVYFVTGT